MSEQQSPPEHGDEPVEVAPEHLTDDAGTQRDSVETTGHPVVDDVVASVAGLDDRPVAEHVEVFESAHDRLRSALADAGDDSST